MQWYFLKHTLIMINQIQQGKQDYLFRTIYKILFKKGENFIINKPFKTYRISLKRFVSSSKYEKFVKVIMIMEIVNSKLNTLKQDFFYIHICKILLTDEWMNGLYVSIPLEKHRFSFKISVYIPKEGKM